jgi:hypothetical protein
MPDTLSYLILRKLLMVQDAISNKKSGSYIESWKNGALL